MKTKNILAVALLSLLIVACTPPVERAEMGKGKVGGLYEISETGKAFIMSDGSDTLLLDTASFIPFDQFKFIQKEYDQFGRDAIGFTLNDEGAKVFEKMTERNVGKQLCFVVREEIIWAPMVQSPIPGGRLTVSMSDSVQIRRTYKYLTGK